MKRDPIPLLSFGDVKEIVASGRLEKLGRSPQQQEVYNNFYANVIMKNWKSGSDFILANKFGFLIVLDDDLKRAVKRPLPTTEEKIVLLKNDFPYNLESDIEHFILWKINGSVTEAEIDAATAELRVKYNVQDSVFYINPPQLKSIPDIDHAHIMIKVATYPGTRYSLIKYSGYCFATLGAIWICWCTVSAYRFYGDCKYLLLMLLDPRSADFNQGFEAFSNIFIPSPIKYLIKGTSAYLSWKAKRGD